MSDTFIISFLAIALALLAVLAVCIFLLHTTRKVVDRNQELTRQVLEQKQAATDIGKIRDTISASENPAQMTDAELLSWLDRKLDETRLYTNPDVDVKAISAYFGLSQRRLLRLMKLENAPGSIPAWLVEKRLAYACKLLSSKQEFKIEAISQEAGFRSRRTFQNLFKQRLGVTPSAYRTLVQNGHPDLSTKTVR